MRNALEVGARIFYDPDPRLPGEHAGPDEGGGALRAGRGAEVAVSSASNLGQCFPSVILEKYIKY